MTLEKVLRGVVLGGLFLLPFIVLYVSRSLFFPFITGKNFAFRIIIEIIAGGYLALLLTNPAYRPKKSWLLWAFTAFVLCIGVADIFGTYPHKSFWSNYERMEGWISLAHLLVYFVVMQAMLTTEKLWKQWWHTSLVVSGIMAIYALFQLTGFITINQSDVRLDATFGNSTYLGIYMFFHIFIAALYLARAWIESPQKRTSYTLMYGSLIAVNSLILFYTSTRGAILGLIGGAALSALILIFLNPRSPVARYAGAAIAGLLVLASAFWLVKDTAWVHSIEPLHRIASISEEGLPDARQMNWGMAWEGFKERPILGWGQENYAAVFDKYYDPGMYAQEPWFDRVHNIIFDWLIAGGILGLLSYLALYVLALAMVWRSGAFLPYERAMFTGLFAGYFFYLLFTFDNITSYLFFVAILAYITVRAAPRVEAQKEWLPQSALPWTALGSLVLVCGTVWYVNADAIAQNRSIILAIMPQSSVEKNLEYFNTTTAYDSVGNQEAREQFSQAAISVIGAGNIPLETKQKFAEDALRAMNELEEEAPHNARFPLFSAILLDQAGAYEEGHAALTRARELSPTKQSILFESGLNAFARGSTAEAVAFFKKAYDLAPAYAQARNLYIAALIRAGNDAEANALLSPLIGDIKDQHIAAAYAGKNQYGKIIEIWKAYVAKHPEDSEAHIVLASAYYAAGNSVTAIKELEKLKAAHPDRAVEADQLIQQVRAGKP